MALFQTSRSSLKGVDALLAAVGLEHGKRRLLRAGYEPQARHPRQQAPARQEGETAPRTGLHVLRAGKLDGIAHGFSTRSGGSSRVYLRDSAADDDRGELNLGLTASDSPEHVRSNRAQLVQKVFGRELPLSTLRQTHSALIHRVDRSRSGRETVLQGDGLITDEPGVVLAIQTADCVPVLLADKRRGAVAAFHAGWRGTLSRIVERGAGRMRAEFGSAPEDMVAAIGPSIGPCCYGIGEEVEHEFRSQFTYAEELFCEVYDADPIRKKYPMLFLTQRAPGHSDLGPSLHLDLQEANRRQLLAAGLRADAIEVLPHCTSCRTDLFFSHRAEDGFTGRMMAVIARTDRG